MSVHNK